MSSVRLGASGVQIRPGRPRGGGALSSSALASRRAVRPAGGGRAALGSVAALVLGLVMAPSAVAATASPGPSSSGSSTSSVTEQAVVVPAGPEADGSPVSLDASVFTPGGRAPARGWPSVVLAHGYGGTKDDLASQARDLAGRGYVVAAYTARGFGASGGRIHLGSPAFEGADVSAVIDVLAARGDVERDDGSDPAGGADPVVGVAGASYGGEAALLAEGGDARVDAVAAAITWHDLAEALTPQAAAPLDGSAAPPGVLKAGWVGALLRPGAASAPARGAGPGERALPPGSVSSTPGCGRLADDFCAAYLATTSSPGQVPTPELTALLRASSPARVLDGARAPVLLVQGEADTLFGLDQSLANADQLRAAGAPVQVVWSAGGHDAGAVLAAEFPVRTREFFAEHLVPAGERSGSRAAQGPGFTYALPLPAVAALVGDGGGGGSTGGDGSSDGSGDEGGRSGPVAPLRAQGRAPTAAGPSRGDATLSTVALAPPDGAPAAQPVLAPAGGRPAARTSLPGLGVLSSLPVPALSAGAVLPGQAALFESAPLETARSLAGPVSVDLDVSAPGGSAVLFAGLYDVEPSGAATLPGGGVAAMRVAVPAGAGAPVAVRVDLPALARQVPAGHRLRLVVSSTDDAFALPAEPALHGVALSGRGLLRATVAGPTNTATAPLESATTVPTTQVVVAAVLLLGAALAAAVVALRRRRALRAGARDSPRGRAGAVAASAGGGAHRDGAHEDGAHEDGSGLVGAAGGDRGDPDATVLDVRDLVLEYRGGVRAVDGASFTVGRGQVVGLLGPNGAGKTTALRVVLGLLRPTSGSAHLLGQEVRPGAPVLARVGALVEGTGFLPHLSGRENLELFWRATGRPAADAHLDRALAVADLGERVERRVGSYSQGMRMRLGIASALLGLPELLILDEPTNGLDPPQINAMRQVLRDYAATGRTVLVSSHLLAEVEATCTHVVVMARGAVVAQGSVDDLIGTTTAIAVAVGAGQGGAALEALTAVGGVEARVDEADDDGDRLLVALDGAGPDPGSGRAGESEPGVAASPAGAVGADVVVAALVGAGVAVRAVVPQRHLEQVFLELVAP